MAASSCLPAPAVTLKAAGDIDFRLGEALGAAGHKGLAKVFFVRATKSYVKAVRKAKRGGR